MIVTTMRLSLLVFLALAGCAPRAAVQHAPMSSDTAEALEAHRTWWRAFALGDTARLPALTDSTLRLTLSTGETFDREGMLRHAENRGDSSQVRIAWSEEAVDALDSSAVVTSRFEETIRGVHGAFRFTSVLRRGSDGAWRVTATHSTRVPPVPVAVRVPATELQAFAGRYRLPDGGVLTFVVRDGSLAIRLPNGREDLLVPVTAATFELPGRARLAFARDARGRVTGLAFIAARGVDEWMRLP